MKNIILLIILILTSSTLIGQTTPFTINAEGEVASSKAFHSLKSTDSKKPDGNVQGCKCNGTKVVKSGDGLINVPCPCGKNCTCGTGMVKASPQLPEKYFSTKPIKEAFEDRDFTESLRSLEKLNRSIINMVEGVFSHKIMNNRNKKAA